MPPEPLAELLRFAPDCYGLRYDNHTALFIVTDEGVVVVDPCGERHPRAPFLLKEAIRTLTDQPVKYVLYSHWGADHGTGGAVFADTAQFLSHANAAPKIAAAKDPASPVPHITFDREYTLELGGKRIELLAADLSPSDDYFILHYPAGRLVMAVDFAQPRNVPFRTFIGHPDWIARRLQWMYDNLDFDVLVTGHAFPQPWSTRQDLLEARDYITHLSEAIDSARAAGLSDASHEMAASVRQQLAPRYGQWRRFDEMLAENVQGMIRWRQEVPA